MIQRKHYQDIVDTEDPRKALELLWTAAQSDDRLLRSCHYLVHEIGHRAYQKYGSFPEAMQYQNEMCNSGYMHGVIEIHFENAESITRELRTVCNSYPLISFERWECVHGVGHGVMYFTLNNLPESLSLCEKYTTEFEQQTCANGVFMENFAVDGDVHISEYVRDTDLFYPCSDQTERYKTDCYGYAPIYYLSLYPNEYQDALEWCGGAEPEYVHACVFGVGSQMMKENVSDPLHVEEMCEKDARYRANCIAGMTTLYVNHYGEIAPAEDLCPRLREENRTVCMQTIEGMRLLF